MLTATLKIAIREPQLHDVRVGRPPKNAKRRGGPQNEDEIYASSDRIRRRVARGNCLFSCVLPDNTPATCFPLKALKKFTGGTFPPPQNQFSSIKSESESERIIAPKYNV